VFIDIACSMTVNITEKNGRVQLKMNYFKKIIRGRIAK